MTIHLHRLLGCSPTPLAHYLKAIGILRIVAQQKDTDVRGFWRDDHFHLLTELDRSALEHFFLDTYAPSPFVSPWNKGSGFYAEQDKGLSPIEGSKAPRLRAFREAISAAREPLDAIANADARVREIKERTKLSRLTKQQRESLRRDPEYKRELADAERQFKKLKAELFAPLSLKWRGPHREWMDAAMVLSSAGEPSWPALLGTGGNDGRLDFTNNAMQRLADLFDASSGTASPNALSLLGTALWRVPSAGVLDGPVGQFLPGCAGGANGTTGPEAGSRVNPWDFVLMLEGAIAFRGRATKRLGAAEVGRAAVPFAVTAQSVGHATRGREKDARGEQWMPLWDLPATWTEVSVLFGEARAQLGRSSARRPLDFARAVGRLGVARGLTGFVRYGYLERNGQSNLAVPLGRIEVAAHARARLIDELGEWLDRLQVEANDGPARLAAVVGMLSDSVFDVLTREAEPSRWQSLLLALDSVQCVQASGSGFNVGPCPTLSPAWLEAAADDSPEWRLALALGSSARSYGRELARVVDPVRAHALPIDPQKPWRYATRDKRLVNDSRVVMTGRDPLGDLIALVNRRLVEASQRATRSLPLVARRGAGARLDDLARFLAGELDVERVVGLGRALMAIDWRRVDSINLQRASRTTRGERPDDAWQALRLCAVPFRVHERELTMEPAMFRKLASGDTSAAVEIALRRLRASGFRPPIQAAITDTTTARRWAAAFAFPIDPYVANAMATRFENPTATETA